MKRLIIRISALAVVLAIGGIVIAQAQRGDRQSSISIESDVETIVTDSTTEQQDESQATTIAIMPPQPLPAKSFDTKASTKLAPEKLAPATSVLAIKGPPPVLGASGSKPNSDPNPLRGAGMAIQPAASSVALSSSSSRQIAQALCGVPIRESCRSVLMRYQRQIAVRRNYRLP